MPAALAESATARFSSLSLEGGVVSSTKTKVRRAEPRPMALEDVASSGRRQVRADSRRCECGSASAMAASCVCGARCAAAGICGVRAGVDLAGTDAQSEIEAIIPSRQMLALRNLRLRPATIPNQYYSLMGLICLLADRRVCAASMGSDTAREVASRRIVRVGRGLAAR